MFSVQGPVSAYGGSKSNDGYDWDYSTRTRNAHRSARDSESSDSTTYSFDATSDLVTDENNTSSASSYSSISPGPPNEQETAVNNDISRARASPTTTIPNQDSANLPSTAPRNDTTSPYNIRDILKTSSPDPPKQLFNLSERESTSTRTLSGGFSVIKSSSTQSRDFTLRGLADEVGHENRAALPEVGATLYNTSNVNFRPNKDTFCRVGVVSNGHAYQPTADKPPLMGMHNDNLKDVRLPVQASFKHVVDRLDRSATSVRVPSFPGHRGVVGNAITQPKTTQGYPQSERPSSEGLNYWRKPLIDQIVITDVTANFVTVTVKECLTDEGFFKPRPSGIV